MRYYGLRSTGNRHPEDPELCVVEVPTDPFGYHQCLRRRGKGGPDGEFCTQHAKAYERGKHLSIPREEAP